MRLKVLFIFLITLIALSGCSQSEEEKISEETKKISLVEIPPTKERGKIPESLFPQKFSWRLFKGTERSDFYYASFIPRKPEVEFKVAVKPNFGGKLSTPIVFEDLVLISDSKVLYAYSRQNGKLEWMWSYNSETDIKAYGAGESIYVAIFKTYAGEKYDLILVALDEEGGKLWESKVTSKQSNFATTLLVAEKKVFVGTVNGFIYCFSEGGDFLWERKIGGIVRGLAYGEGILFATSEAKREVFALDVNGDIRWMRDTGGEVGTPIYSKGRVLLVSASHLLCFSKDGELLWKKGLGAGTDVNRNSLLSAGRAVYVARTVGEKPLNLYILNFEGDEIGKFALQNGENPGIPVTTEDIVLLPVTKYNEYSKLYFLWKGKEDIYELKVGAEETFQPRISIDEGEIFVVFSINRTDGYLYKFSDRDEPLIKDIKAEIRNDSLLITSVLHDPNSSIYRAFVFYSMDSEWKFSEMFPARRYIIEPVGGYGFSEEPYEAKIEVRPNSTVEFYILAIDKVGNYRLSKNSAYRISI
jgi:outer membrane protein assembly factor BamB